MASENTVLRQTWLALGGECRLFRVNTGQAWVSGGGPVKVLKDGTAAVPYGRPVSLGFSGPDGKPVVGTPDLCGWTPVVITPDMVGRTIPVFTGVETKASSGGNKRDGQINFIAQLHKVGGIAGFAKSPEQAKEILQAWKEGRAPDVM